VNKKPKNSLKYFAFSTGKPDLAFKNSGSTLPFFNHLVLFRCFFSFYLCPADERGDSRQTRQHRSFEDFSYGKQSLDGLLFPQRAFLFSRTALPSLHNPSPHNLPNLPRLPIRPSPPPPAFIFICIDKFKKKHLPVAPVARRFFD
jgi:hypothetical protein